MASCNTEYFANILCVWPGQGQAPSKFVLHPFSIATRPAGKGVAHYAARTAP